MARNNKDPKRRRGKRSTYKWARVTNTAARYIVGNHGISVSFDLHITMKKSFDGVISEWRLLNL